MKSTTSISKIKTEFSLQNATSFGGVKVFLDFLEKIKLPKAMRGLSGGKAHNAVFPLHRILPYLIVGWMLGLSGFFIFASCSMTPCYVIFWADAARITACYTRNSAD